MESSYSFEVGHITPLMPGFRQESSRSASAAPFERTYHRRQFHKVGAGTRHQVNHILGHLKLQKKISTPTARKPLRVRTKTISQNDIEF